LPCDFCQKHLFTCEFVLSRQRRGPRPKSREFDNDETDMTIDQQERIVDHITPEKAASPAQDMPSAHESLHFNNITTGKSGHIEGWQDVLKKVMVGEEVFATGFVVSSCQTANRKIKRSCFNFTAI
jgi:hypothetical protein